MGNKTKSGPRLRAYVYAEWGYWHGCVQILNCGAAFGLKDDVKCYHKHSCPAKALICADKLCDRIAAAK